MDSRPRRRLLEDSSDPLDRIVREAAERHKVDPALVKAVISTESGWNPRAVSRKGAVGLMQLIPETAAALRRRQSFRSGPECRGRNDVPEIAARPLQRRFDEIARGIQRRRARRGSISAVFPMYPETQKYVQKVTDTYFRPGSGRNPTLWSPPKAPVRREVDSNGRVVFTNE